MSSPKKAMKPKAEKAPQPNKAKSDPVAEVPKKTAKPKAVKAAKPAKKKVNLAALSEGMPGLTVASGQVLAEAAAVCLEDQKHQTGVSLSNAGLTPGNLQVEWLSVDDQQRRSHADMQEATERGACGVAILVVKEATGLVVVERSRKGTGFDYWVGDKDTDSDGLPFEGLARLEVSGILAGTQRQIDARMKQKKAQIKPTDKMAPGYVAVVEFRTPIACVELK